ncbi:MAG: M1 family peptidase, partial [Gemmatimonadota bacterium]
MGALRTLFAAVAAILFVALAVSPTAAQTRDPYDSGGVLTADQAAFDALYYALDVRVEPSDSSITGSLVMSARLESPTPEIGLDLDPLLDVYAVDLQSGAAFESAQWTRDGGRITVPLPESVQPGQIFAVRVEYGGMPRVAPRPPWDGGFTWARTEDGSPWIATSNQTIGADVWWPVKDHITDKPDSMSIRVTVPE